MALKRLLVLMKHYTRITGKLKSSNAILQNLQNMDCNIKVYEMLKSCLSHVKPDSNDNKYYATGTHEYTKYLVNNFLSYNKLTGRNKSFDRYFTSITLAQWCLEKKISIVGKMRTDRKGIPKEMKEEEKSTKYCHLEDN